MATPFNRFAFTDMKSWQTPERMNYFRVVIAGEKLAFNWKEGEQEVKVELEMIGHSDFPANMLHKMESIIEVLMAACQYMEKTYPDLKTKAAIKPAD